jgi:digeranylgeranylglycerophospholipid reductase
MKLIVIGAGPVGSYAASILAKSQEALLFEEHATIGAPVHCTGIVTPEIFRFIPKKSSCIINKIYDVRIFAPNGSFIPIHFKQPDIILDRVAFDQYFFSLACKAGVHTYLKHRFLSFSNDAVKIKDLSTGKIKNFKFDKLIGADGPNSAVGRSAGLLSRSKFFTGIQAVVKKKNNNILDFYPFKDGFGWCVPEDSNTLRVGVACQKNPKNAFEHLLKKCGGRVVDKHGGLIPLYNPKAKFCSGNVSLVGDAAGFVKATTGGGLVPGLRSAEILAKSINKKVNYETRIFISIFPGLFLNLKMRKIMDSFLEEDWNSLIRELNNPESKKALQSINRDKAFSLMTSIAVHNPKIIRFGFK